MKTCYLHLLFLSSLYFPYCVCERRFNVTHRYIADSWQSSGSPDKCFNKTANFVGLWSYFDTGTDMFDSYGYQWLLVKLTRSVRVLSVTVQAVDSSKDGAHDVEILLSDKLPTGVLNVTSGCQAKIAHDAIDFSTCGWTGGPKATSLRREVNCNFSDVPQMTNYILLRRNVTNIERKFMTMAWLEVRTASPFYLCPFHRSNSNPKLTECTDLKQFKSGSESYVRALLPCYVFESRTNCSIKSATGEYMSVEVSNHLKRTLLRFSGNNRVHGWSLHCQFGCTDGQVEESNDTIGFTQESSNLNMIHNATEHATHGKTYWMAEKSVTFTIISESVYPAPKHICKLVGDNCSLSDHVLNQDAEAIQETEKTNSCHFCVKFMTNHSLLVNSSLKSCMISCESRSKGGKPGAQNKKQLTIPDLLYPCKTKLIHTSNNSWREGATVNFTLDSSDSKWPGTTVFSCLLEPEKWSKALTAFQGSQNITTFSLNVTRRMSNAFILCHVNQSGLCTQWLPRYQIPKVHYKANVSIQLLPTHVCAGSNATVFIKEHEAGYPPTVYNCNVSGRYIGNASVIQFKPMTNESSLPVSCSVVQTDSEDSSAAYIQRVDSSDVIRFYYQENNSWSEPKVVKEGELLSVTVTSFGGNPVPSHRCWLQLPNGPLVDMANNISTQNASTVGNFSIIANKSMNGGSLICNTTHQCANQSTIRNITVFYKANATIQMIPAASPTCLDSHVTFTIKETQSGNPTAQFNCSISSRHICLVTSDRRCSYESMKNDNGSRILCNMKQVYMHNNQGIYTDKLESEVIIIQYPANSSWTAKIPQEVKEGELLSVSVTSVGGNPAPSHQCWLKLINRTLIEFRQKTISASREIVVSNFTLVSQRFMNGSLLVCNVTHPCSTRMFTNSTVTVFHKTNASIHLNSLLLCAGSNATLFINESDRGNPQPVYNCSISGQQICNLTSKGRCLFNPIISENDHPINCRVVQRDSNNTMVFEQLVNSSDVLRVYYSESSSWTATKPLQAKEGDLLSVAVTSVSSNSNLSYQCWVKLLNGSQITANKSCSENASHVISNFSIIPGSFMNGGSLVCNSSNHLCETKKFTQSLTIFYNFTVTYDATNYNKSHLTLRVNVSIGNPMPNCSLTLMTWSGKNTTLNLKGPEGFSNGSHVILVSRLECSFRGDVYCYAGQQMKTASFTHRYSFGCNHSSHEFAPNYSLSNAKPNTYKAAATLTPMTTSTSLNTNQHTPTNTATVAALIATGSLLVAIVLAALLCWQRRSTAASTTAAAVVDLALSQRRSSTQMQQSLPLSPQLGESAIVSATSSHQAGESSLEYATVNNSRPLSQSGLTGSTETLYTEIIGHLTADGRTLVSREPGGKLIKKRLK